MSAAIAPASTPIRQSAPAERREGPGLDRVNDNDADDRPVAPKIASTPQGAGKVLDISA